MADERWFTVAKKTADTIVELYPDGNISEKDEAMLVIALCETVARFAEARGVDPSLVILTLLKVLAEAYGGEVSSVPMVADNGRVH